MIYTEKLTWAGRELKIKRESSPVDVVSAESEQVRLEKININNPELFLPTMPRPRAQSCRCFRPRAYVLTSPRGPKNR